VPGTAVDILEGQNVVGEETTLSKKAYELFVPMIIQDIQEGWKEQGPSAIATVGIPSFFGVGVSTFGPKQTGTTTSKKVDKSRVLKTKK